MYGGSKENIYGRVLPLYFSKEMRANGLLVSFDYFMVLAVPGDADLGSRGWDSISMLPKTSHRTQDEKTRRVTRKITKRKWITSRF